MTHDPYLLIAQATNFIDYLPAWQASDPVDLILEVTADGAKWLLEAPAGSGVLVNRAHLQAGSRFVTARMPLGALDQLAKDGLVIEVELAQPLRHQRPVWPEAPVGGGALQVGPVLGASPSSPTLAAIIDDGCPFAHAEFLTPGENRTRIVTLWDMDPAPELAFPEAATAAGFCWGREVPYKVLQQWIADNTSDGHVDESACYAAAGYTAVSPELTHGSHLLGRLAGASYCNGGAVPDPAALVDIAFVQLPRREQESPGSGSIHASVLDALRYLRRFAQKSGFERCVVVCAKGSSLGPHDGTSLFERALQAVLEESARPRFDIVFPAGNAYEEGVHAVLRPTPGKPASVAWMLPGANEVPTFAELWIDTAADKVKISVELGDAPQELVDGVVTVVTPWLTAVRTGPRVTLRAAPTRVSGDQVPAQAGRVSLIAEATAAAVVHGYVCWGGRNLGCMRESRQAEWRVPADGGNTAVDGRGTMIGDACGSSERIHVAGGYVGAGDPSQLLRARYSAAGPSRGTPASRTGPEYLATTETNSATRGVEGPGTRSGIVKRVWGTSVAAPQAARALVNGNASFVQGAPQLAAEEGGAGFLA